MKRSCRLPEARGCLCGCSGTMRLSYPQDPKLTTRLQLALLLIAAMACVATMLAGFVNGHGLGSVEFDLRHTWLFLTVAVGALAAIAVIWRMGSVARREARAAKSESVHLRRNLAAADAIIRAEPQVLVFCTMTQCMDVLEEYLQYYHQIQISSGIMLFGLQMKKG